MLLTLRRRRLLWLLDWWHEVEQGIYESRGQDSPPGMCRAWNHPSYAELRRLLPELQTALPEPYWHLAEAWLRWREERRVAWCPTCSERDILGLPLEAGIEHLLFPPVWPDEMIGQLHRHGRRKASQLVPRTVRHVSRAVRPAEVARAVAWLDVHWGRWDISIPEDIWQALDHRRSPSAALEARGQGKGTPSTSNGQGTLGNTDYGDLVACQVG